MKRLLIYPILLLLASCNLFQSTPQSVIDGQRAVAQSLIIAKENDAIIIDRYMQDCKAAVTYHINWVFEPHIDLIRRDLSLSDEERLQKISELERQRESNLNDAYSEIEKNAQSMRSLVSKNHEITQKLVESIYYYLSATPLELDNIEFWIEKLKKVENGQ